VVHTPEAVAHYAAKQLVLIIILIMLILVYNLCHSGKEGVLCIGWQWCASSATVGYFSSEYCWSVLLMWILLVENYSFVNDNKW